MHDPFSIHTTVHQREGVLLAEVALTSLLNRAVYLWNVHFESANPALIAVEDLNATTTDEAAAVAAAGAPAPAEGAAAADPTAQSHDGARARTSSAAAAEKPGQGVLLPGQSSRSFLFRLIELKPASKVSQMLHRSLFLCFWLHSRTRCSGIHCASIARRRSALLGLLLTIAACVLLFPSPSFLFSSVSTCWTWVVSKFAGAV